MSFGDFKALEKDLGLDTVSQPFNFDINGALESVNSILNNTGSVIGTYKNLEKQLNNEDSAAKDAARKNYTDITQNVSSTTGQTMDKSKMFIYGGIALAAIIVLRG